MLPLLDSQVVIGVMLALSIGGALLAAYSEIRKARRLPPPEPVTLTLEEQWHIREYDKPAVRTPYRCGCAHTWKRMGWHAEDATTKVVYRCLHCDARLFRQSDAHQDEYYAMWCNQAANPPDSKVSCAWPGCVAAERPRGKRVGDQCRKILWELGGNLSSWQHGD